MVDASTRLGAESLQRMSRRLILFFMCLGETTAEAIDAVKSTPIAKCLIAKGLIYDRYITATGSLGKFADLSEQQKEVTPCPHDPKLITKTLAVVRRCRLFLATLHLSRYLA